MTGVLSDWLFTSAFGIYMLAALLGAAEFSLTHYAGQQGAAARCGKLGVASTVLGGLLHGGSVVLRGIAAGRVPWGNMYEYLSAVGLVAVAAWLYVVWKHDVRRLAAACSCSPVW